MKREDFKEGVVFKVAGLKTIRRFVLEDEKIKQFFENIGGCVREIGELGEETDEGFYLRSYWFYDTVQKFFPYSNFEVVKHAKGGIEQC